MTNEGKCFAKQSVIAYECRLCKRTLVLHLKRLEEMKLIRKKRVWKMNHYFMGEYFNSSSAFNASDNIKVSPYTRSNAAVTHDQVHTVQTTIDKENKKKIEIIKHTEPPGFLQFWELYPKKVERKPCLQKWISQKLEINSEQIISALKVQIELDYKHKEIRFIPNPLTYLSRERWFDEIKEDSNATCQRNSNFTDKQRKQQDYLNHLERSSKY